MLDESLVLVIDKRQLAPVKQNNNVVQKYWLMLANNV
jgi:hypothetical protein